MPKWNFITNHGAVLALIGQRKRITSREIAAEIGITERSVQRIIQDLEKEGYIRKTKEGRVNTYQVNRELTLRHPMQRDVAIGELLKILGPDS